MADERLTAQIDAAGDALTAFAQGPAREAADAIGESFEKAGNRIARALGQAAVDGETAFRRLAKTILEEAAKIALDRLLPSTGGSGSGGAPSFGGQGVSVVFNLGAGADSESIRRNQSQIAAQVARAAAYGSRNL